MWKVRPSLARRDSAVTTSAVSCSTISWTRREAAAVCPSTARNALVIATEILPASKRETVPLRRITCIGGCASDAARDSGRNRMIGADLASRSTESDIFQGPVDMVGAGCRRRRCMNCRSRAPAWVCERPPDTPPVDVFGVAAGLLARRSRSHPVFPTRCGVSDFDREQLTAYSCGGSAGFSRNLRDSPASLLATKSCDVADRDGYIWCYSPRGVNAFEEVIAKFWPRLCKGCANLFAPDGASSRVDARAALPISGCVEVLRVPLDPELRGKPVQCRRCPRNCKRRAAVQRKSLKPQRFGKAGQQQRPASQETCPDEMFVHGRGVPVVRQAAVARATSPACVRHGLCPQSWG